MLGTAFRLGYAWYGKPYACAPDQLAWELALEEMLDSGRWSYRQIIHYPHEGGSFIMGLLAIVFMPFKTFLPPLSLAALVVNTLSRYIQIKSTGLIFGTRTGEWYAWWTVLASPLLVCWSSVNFGLHALSAFWPFIFISIMVGKHRHKNLLAGIVTALAIGFSYDNLVLLPVYILWQAFSRYKLSERFLQVSWFLAGLVPLLVVHLLIRVMTDAGFHEAGHTLTSIRGEELKNINIGTWWQQIMFTLHTIIPESYWMQSLQPLSPAWQRYLFLVLGGVGIAGVAVSAATYSPGTRLSLLFIAVFIGLYAYSPFFTQQYDVHYVSFRYMAYLAPLLMATILSGYAGITAWVGRVGAFLLMAGTIYTGLFFHKTLNCPDEGSYKAAGWIIALKFSDDTSVMQRICNQAPPENRPDLLEGYAWGLTALYLNHITIKDDEAIHKLVQRLNEFPPETKPLMLEGISIAFKPRTTPILDSCLYEVVVQHYSQP